jgi:hypothetical protein
MNMMSMRQLRPAALLLALLPLHAPRAETPAIELAIRNHVFEPAELHVPANTKIRLIVINHDATPEEFESYELNREKIVLGNSRAVIFIGPLAPGEYPFFGEFNITTAQGKLIAR